MYVFRSVYKLENYITERHFDKMGKILVMLALLYLYFNVNEYLVPAFKMKKPEEEHLTMLFAGEFAPLILVCHFCWDDYSHFDYGVSRKEENPMQCLWLE